MSKFTEAVTLFQAGCPSAEIAKKLELKPSTIEVYLSRAKKNGLIPRDGDVEVTIRIPRIIDERIKQEAERREYTPRGLIADLVSLIARDNLFKAVIDD